MIMARTVIQSVAPLFAWREQGEIDRLETQRAALIERIRQLRPHCHRRIELQTRLTQLTAQQLQLTLKMRGKP